MIIRRPVKEVMIFRYTHTLHHNIYIIIIFITITIPISKIKSKESLDGQEKRTKCDDMKTLQHAALSFNLQYTTTWKVKKNAFINLLTDQ